MGAEWMVDYFSRRNHTPDTHSHCTLIPYRMLSRRGNPQLSSLTSILESAGLRVAVEVRHHRVA